VGQTEPTRPVGSKKRGFKNGPQEKRTEKGKGIGRGSGGGLTKKLRIT